MEGHLRFLVEAVGSRPPGSPADAVATDHVREVLPPAYLSRISPSGVWWEPGPGRLTVGGGSAAAAPDLLRDVAHTPRDTLDVVDVAVLADLAEALPALVAAASTTSHPPGGGAPHAAAWRGAR